MTRLQDISSTLLAGRDLRLKTTLLAAGMVTATFGLLTLLGWISGSMQLATFGANRIPMAPSTATLFILYGIAIGGRARSPMSRLAYRISLALVCLSMLVALVLLTLGGLDIQWAGEHLGLNITGTVGGAAIGHMSPVTAFCFLLAAVTFLASLSPSTTRPWRFCLALVSAGVLLATSFIFLLAYSFGTPLLYSSTFIPPALNTILAFTTLGLALLALTLLALTERPGELFRGSSEDDAKPALTFVLIFLLLALGIAGTGYAYYRNYERQFRAAATRQLAAVAELKIGELTRYRKERLNDAAILHDNPVFTRLVRNFLASPANADAHRTLQVWLDKYQGHLQYDQILLLDAQGTNRMSAPAGLAPFSSTVARGAIEGLRTGQMQFLDFYRSEYNQRIYLALLVPILDEEDGNRPLGVLVLRIDPTVYLYPFISRWPVSSATAETLLVRREGNEVVFLNELRFQTNTALTLRHSLDNSSLPAAMVALGHEGIVDGLDYRGVPVLAAVRAVPDSPWFLVARRDVADVYAPLRTQLWQVSALVGVLLFGAGAGVGLVWRQQRVRFYRARAEAGEALQKSQSLLMEAEKLGRVGGWEFDIETGQLTWTEMVYDIHELDHADRPTVEQAINFYTPQSRPIIEQAVQCAINQGEPFDLKLEIVTAQGNRRNVCTSGRADLALGKVSGFIQDITERKQVEEELLQNKERFEVIFEQSPLGIGVIDSQTGQICQANSKYANIVGRTLEEMVTIDWMSITHPEDVQKDRDNMALLNAGKIEGFQMEKRYIRPDGTPVWASMSVKPLPEEGKLHPRHLAIIEDITERRKAEEAQRQSRRAALNMMSDAIEARERAEQMSLKISQMNADLEQRVAQRTHQLEAANKELEAFCYSVSHDLRAPLRHVDGYVELLLSRCRADLPEKGLHYLDTIAASARQMGELIDDLLQFSRTGRAELRLENTDMNQMLKEALTRLQEGTSGRSIEWVISELPTVQGDHALLRQVWVNLLDNALKYTKTRGIPRITVSTRQENGEIVFSVADNGVGFDMKYSKKLFGVFQRLHSVEEFEGTGIGLATVQRIINRHGGRVWAESNLDNGAAFYFTLPFPKDNNHA